MNKDRLILALHERGYGIACNLLIKILPHLEEGIQIVGFLREVVEIDHSETPVESLNEIFYLLYRTDNRVLQLISPNCDHNLGIPSWFCEGNLDNTEPFGVDAICPDLVDPLCIEEMKTPNGLDTVIDTTIIAREFLE